MSHQHSRNLRHIQRTAAYFLSLGHYDAQINRIGQAYKARRAVMDRAIREAGLTVVGRDSFGGSSFWMQAAQGVDTARLALELRDKGVLIEPGRIFFGQRDAPSNCYRLAYSSISATKIPAGIALIARSLGQPGLN